MNMIKFRILCGRLLQTTAIFRYNLFSFAIKRSIIYHEVKDMELQKVLTKRRSIRKYKKEKIAHEIILEIIEAARYAPSWKNSQTARYHVVESETMLKVVKETCLPEFNATNCQDAPVLIVCSFVKNRSGFERDGTASNELANGWGCYDLGLHNQSLLLKATELGIASLVMGIRDEKSLREVLKIDAKETIVSVIALGYGMMEPEMPARKEVSDITHFY